MKIPEIPLKPDPRTPEAKAAVGFEYVGPPIGTRSKIGGVPDWIQSPVDVQCDGCRTAMSFYAQIDSVGDNVILADCGLVYVFVCFDCYESKSIVQC
jgi:hypothetical protein